MASPTLRISLDESSPSLTSPEATAELSQRLVICLDGTWNKRDSGTNIYHLSNLIAEGSVGAGDQRRTQRLYYDEGVGTGMLDNVTGGAFGIGLSDNVRQAYDWLIEKYNEGDEVYIFGFSRGAFTARSLVGLIGKCGLLRRGAPMSQDELWRAYQILGHFGNVREQTSPKKSLREHLFGRTPPPFRPLWLLERDSWEGPGRTCAEPESLAEQLLVRWSRRIPITCLGVFDTVGSMGLDALALPWVRDRATQFHDTRLTSIVVNGYHALAIDEHRSNFRHIPWHRAPDEAAGPTKLGGELEQRWFIGAHSNVGGGYDDNVLTQIPLAWMLRKVTDLPAGYTRGPRPPAAPALAIARTGLVLRPVTGSAVDPRLVPPCRPPFPEGAIPARAEYRSDSYAAFGAGIWQHVIRAKRHYRTIAPDEEIIDGQPGRSAAEIVDESVLHLREAASASGATGYRPPNLWAFLKYKATPATDEPAPPHRYLDSGRSAAFLGLWLLGVAFTGRNLGMPLGGAAWVWGAAGAAMAALAVDWTMSLLSHRFALNPYVPNPERQRRILAWLTYARILAVIAAVAGLGFAAAEAWRWLYPAA